MAEELRRRNSFLRKWRKPGPNATSFGATGQQHWRGDTDTLSVTPERPLAPSHSVGSFLWSPRGRCATVPSSGPANLNTGSAQASTAMPAASNSGSWRSSKTLRRSRSAASVLPMHLRTASPEKRQVINCELLSGSSTVLLAEDASPATAAAAEAPVEAASAEAATEVIAGKPRAEMESCGSTHTAQWPNADLWDARWDARTRRASSEEALRRLHGQVGLLAIHTLH